MPHPAQSIRYRLSTIIRAASSGCDMNIIGGFVRSKPGQMLVVGARPGVGKSTLGLDLARAAAMAHGQATVIFSLEMSHTEIMMRLLSAEASVPLEHLRSGQMSDDD